jgi:hypothetical protein
MKPSTKRRKAASRHIPKVVGQDAFFTEKLVKVVAEGKAAFDSLSFELGRTLAEAIMYMDREQVSGPDYLPTSSEIQKWASQPGSVFIGDQKVKVERPRLRGPEGEIHLQSYQKLKERGLRLSKRVIFITDGGKGVIKALRDNKMSLTKKQRPLGIRNISGVHSQFQLKMRHSLNFGFQGFILERYL